MARGDGGVSWAGCGSHRARRIDRLRYAGRAVSDLGRRLREVIARESGGRGALLIDDDGAHHAADLAAAARSLALRLERATADGDRIVIDAPRGASWLTSFLACVLAGRVAVPLAEGAPPAEVAAVVERAGASCSLVAAGGGATLPPGLAVIDAGARDHDAGDPAADDLARDGAGADAALGSSPALFLFTSGTTGRSKAAVITHDNLSAQAEALASAWGLGPGDVLLHALPLHHTHGVVVALLATLLAGGRVRLLRRFEPRRVWEELAAATVWMAVPTMTAKLFEAFDAASEEERARWTTSARALRLATSGSAALPVGLAARWRAVSGCIPLERYGMTEIGMALSNPLDPTGRRAGSVGVPLPGVEVRLVDEAGQGAGAGPGELWVRGRSVFAGYFGDPEETARSFSDDPAGRWFHTGDVAMLEGGAYRLLGRASVDILKTGGEKVSALEIEEVLREHEAVGEVAVVGVPDETWGDRVVAAVVPALGCSGACTPEAIRQWAKTRLSPFKVPKQVLVLDALPRNAMGKVQKGAILAMLAAFRASPERP